MLETDMESSFEPVSQLSNPLPRSIARLAGFEYPDLICRLLLLLLSLGISSVTGCDRIVTRITPTQIEEIRTICGSLKVPPSFVKTGQDESDRITHANFSMEYSSSDPPDAIIDFFKKELKEPKWRLESEVKGEPNVLVFKRAGYAVVVIISQTPSNGEIRKHEVSCSKGLY